MNNNYSFWSKFTSIESIIIIIISLILINVIILDYWTIITPKTNIIQRIIDSSPIAQPTSTPSNSCPQSCVAQINQAISQLTPTITIITPTPTKTATPTATPTSSAKEYYVPFGTGSNSTDTWQDISGLQAYIDSAAYGQIKQVIFEVSVHIPTGNETANVRLYNATDDHPVWFSEVYFTGGGSAQYLTSKPITLDNGNKLYKVQMKTQLKYAAYIDQSRVHITTY